MLIVYVLVETIMELELGCDVFDRKAMLIIANNLVNNTRNNDASFSGVEVIRRRRHATTASYSLTFAGNSAVGSAATKHMVGVGGNQWWVVGHGSMVDRFGSWTTMVPAVNQLFLARVLRAYSVLFI